MKTFQNILFFLFVMALTAGNIFAQANNQNPPLPMDRPKEEDLLKMNQCVEKGHQYMKEGKYKEAIQEYEQASALVPQIAFLQYEIAHAYYQMEDYDEAIIRLTTLKQHPESFDQIFQLLGNAYRHEKNIDQAIATYKEGLARFPNSGRLYLELGITDYTLEKIKTAVDYWETGIAAQPSFERNYFHLADYYSETTEKVWAALYGEVFINITTNDERLFDAKDLLFKTYKKAFYGSKDGKIDFTEISIKTQDKKNRMPFQMAFEEIMTQAAKNILPKKQEDFNIITLAKIRKKFIEIWFSEGYNNRFPNSLFDFQKKVIDEGYFESYNIMIFSDFKSDEYKNWAQANSKKLPEYYSWIRDNRYKVGMDNYVSKRKYE